MASAELSRRVEKVVGYPPLVEMDDRGEPPEAAGRQRLTLGHGRLTEFADYACSSEDGASRNLD